MQTTKDNITNKYSKLEQPTKYTDTVKNYVDLVNQPTAMDAIADGFKDYGKLPAKNHGERLNNLTLEGFGDGLKAAENSKRQEKLSPILEQAGQINALAAMYEAQIQEDQIQQRNITEGFKLAAPAYSEWAKAKMAGDETSRQKLAKSVYDSIRSVIQDADMGEFSHEHDGVWYVKDNSTGENKGVNLYHWAMQNGVDFTKMFGADASFVAAASSAGAMNDYKNTQEMERLALDKGRADIDNTKAHTSHLGMQDKKIDNEMSAPKPKYSEKTLNTFHTQNSQWINENREKHNNMNRTANAYEAIAKTIKEEVDDDSFGVVSGGRAGTSFLAMAQRLVNKSGTDSERNQAKLEMLKLPLMEDLKRIYGSRITNFDLEQFLTTLPSLDKNPDAAITEAENRAKEIREEIYNDNLTQEVLEDEFGYSEPYNSLAVQRRVGEKLKSKQLDKADNANQGNAPQPNKFTFTPDKQRN